MKIVCAGFPKTGSKSASAALRHLGYNVADFLETMQYFTGVWNEYMEGRTTIEHVIEEYNKYGFDSHQDVPGNWVYVTIRGSANISQLLVLWLIHLFWSIILDYTK